MIGVGGSQGSGKSTLVRAAAEAVGAAHFSLDDVYRTRTEREAMARDVHPLFRTRGVPGTHDLALAGVVIDSLAAGGSTAIPAFDKLADDRVPQAQWPVFEGRPSAILVEGWCLGALPVPDLAAPINALEAEEDLDGVWRRAWNAELAGPYQAFFDRFDAILFLAAPSFEVVLDWRCEQEAGLLGVPAVSAERRAELARFIAHYERLTRWMLEGGVRADVTVRLGKDRTPPSFLVIPRFGEAESGGPRPRLIQPD